MNTISRKAAVAGIGETTYYKRGGAPEAEFKLGLRAILTAVEDAGLKVSDIDGFASYSMDRNDPPRFAAALGLPDLKFSNMFWGGGGGGGSGALGNAVAAVAAGYANYVVVFRALAQGQFGRFGQGPAIPTVSYPMSYSMPYGMLSPAQMFAMRAQRFMHETGTTQDALKAVALTSYYHAQNNPGAVMYGRPLSSEDYDNSRWIVEPFHLFDCCQENDGAAAMIITSAERARDLKQKPAYVLAAAQGSDYRQGTVAHNDLDYATSNFKTVAKRLYGMAGIQPKDVDVAQLYENFTGGVVMSIVEHGFCAPEETNDFVTFENLKFDGTGKLPLNTSGGNLAHCYMHGLELNVEAVRQVRGTANSQVPGAKIALVGSGPMVQPVSNCILSAD